MATGLQAGFVDIRQELACLRGEAGDPEAEATELEHLVRHLARTRGSRHWYALVAQLMLAIHRTGVHGDSDAFAIEVEQLLPELEQALGADHYVTICAQGFLAMARYASAGDPDTGIAELERALDILERVSGPDDPLAHELRETIAQASLDGQAQDTPARAALSADRVWAWLASRGPVR